MKTFFLCTALVLGVRFASAATPDFSVTVVGYRQGQEHGFNDPQAGKDHGFPIVQLPTQPPPKPLMELDRASERGAHFYVVVRNISKTPVRINQPFSDWFNCLHFSLTTPDGKTFEVHRPYAQNWTWNPTESWVFQPDGMRIFTVDFTTGNWDGLRSPDSIGSRSHFKLDAHFGYRDKASGKELDFHSGPTEVESGP
jgi:hypothetical protein